jgi:hypothetical protein
LTSTEGHRSCCVQSGGEGRRAQLQCEVYSKCKTILWNGFDKWVHAWHFWKVQQDIIVQDVKMIGWKKYNCTLFCPIEALVTLC